MSSDQDLRTELAATAARLIAEDGCDYMQAKRRAVHELLGSGLERSLPLPDNSEIERELRRYLNLFEADVHPRRLAALRTCALHLMERLQQFEPHLIGAVLNGTATAHSDLHLQLFVDSAKDVELYLLDAGIEFEVDEPPAEEHPRALEVLSFLQPAPKDVGLAPGVRDIGCALHVYPRDAIRVAARARSGRDSVELHPVEAAGRANLQGVRTLLRDTTP
jgi:hypothetical protein